MANDKNPTEQLRTRIPATHSERNAASSSSETAGNPWDALQSRANHWDPRPRRHGTMDWIYVLVLLGMGAAVIAALLLLT